jgi:methyl-accepting chemotaxis protein
LSSGSRADTFEKWVDAFDRVRPLRSIIDIDNQNMLPRADEIIRNARSTASEASERLAISQSRTRTGIIAVGIAMVAIGLAFSWLIGRSITRPLNGLVTVMKRLANGDTTTRIPATHAHDEIGEMARTVIVFRDSMIERERLAQTQSEASRAREGRGDMIASTIAQFKNSVETALGKLRAASTKLETSSADLNKAGDTVSSETENAKGRVAAASENVTAAASSVEELAASISEIASQAAKSTEVAGRAVSEAQRTVTTMTELGNAATRIGEVVGLIQAIAGQTNLLALNATIEAARAGVVGHRTGGFHHPRNVANRHNRRRDCRSAELGGSIHRRRRESRFGRGSHRRRGNEPRCRRYGRCPLDGIRRQGPR